MAGANNTGTKAVHFINSSTRTVDGGANGYTIRNDGGPLNLGTSSQNTNINGFVTMPNQPVYGGSFIQYTATTSNYFPATTDIFRVGFSKSNNNRLTAQVAGKYYVSAQQLINTSGTSVYFQILKNGSIVSYAYSNTDDTYDVITSSLIDLQVNDYIEIFYAGTTTYSWPLPHSYYSVFKVS
jgi:hypothetical protein